MHALPLLIILSLVLGVVLSPKCRKYCLFYAVLSQEASFSHLQLFAVHVSSHKRNQCLGSLSGDGRRQVLWPTTRHFCVITSNL